VQRQRYSSEIVLLPPLLSHTASVRSLPLHESPAATGSTAPLEQIVEKKSHAGPVPACTLDEMLGMTIPEHDVLEQAWEHSKGERLSNVVSAHSKNRTHRSPHNGLVDLEKIMATGPE